MRKEMIVGAILGCVLATPAAALPAKRDLPNTLGGIGGIGETLAEEHQYQARNTPPGEPDVKEVYSLPAFSGGPEGSNRTRDAGIGNGPEGNHDDEAGDEDPGLAGTWWAADDGGGGPARAGYDNGNSDPLTDFDNRRDDQ